MAHIEMEDAWNGSGIFIGIEDEEGYFVQDNIFLDLKAIDDLIEELQARRYRLKNGGSE